MDLRRIDKSRNVVLGLGAAIAVLVLLVGFLGWKYHDLSKSSLSKQQVADQKTSDRVVNEVKKIYMLPTDEAPTVARIQDTDKLENQQFFKDAKNGDYVLVFQKNKLALVYRESSHKLVTVGPVNIQDNNSTTPAAP